MNCVGYSPLLLLTLANNLCVNVPNSKYSCPLQCKLLNITKCGPYRLTMRQESGVTKYDKIKSSKKSKIILHSTQWKSLEKLSLWCPQGVSIVLFLKEHEILSIIAFTMRKKAPIITAFIFSSRSCNRNIIWIITGLDASHIVWTNNIPVK